MNHDVARLHIGADPHGVAAVLAEHLSGCAECSQFQREMISLDNDIRRALGKSASGTAAIVTLPVAKAPRKPARTWPGLALAASVALLAVVAVWAFRPSESLAHEVVQHVTLESNSWASDEHVAPEEMRETLALAGVELRTSSNKVMYAHRCSFRGHTVPHLVVSTPKGRVTVLILRYESVRRPMNFHENGLSGSIMPAPKGSIAVLMLDHANIGAVSQEVRQSVQWLP